MKTMSKTTTPFLRACGLVTITLLYLARPLGAAEVPAADPHDSRPVLKVSARTFSLTPKVGSPAPSRTPQIIHEVIGDLKSTLVLFEYGNTRLCFLTSPFGIYEQNMNADCRALIAKELGLTPEQVIAAGSHNHTVPEIDTATSAPQNEARALGREFREGISRAARELKKNLVPVTVEWGVAREERITYNRRGHRADGTAYFIREEDRLLLGDSYIGTIDPDATVVVLRGTNGQPVAALAFFTGHPVTGYNPEKMVSYGQWPQVACEKLSAYLGGVPVAFLQGCAGDVNSKYMLTGTIEQSRQLGEYLGDSYIAAAKSLHPSRRTDMQWTRASVNIPHAPLPSLASLEKDLGSIDDFIRRGNAGDPNTLACVGMNFPLALTPPYRAELVNMVRPWYIWAIDQRKTGEADKLPKTLPLEEIVARIGDVGYVGMPGEPFVRIGLRIKHEAPLPCVLTSGYTDGSSGYIGDALASNDREYMGGFYRYILGRQPYRAPAGDTFGDVAIPILTRFAQGEK
jgi:hypothetical protein